MKKKYSGRQYLAEQIAIKLQAQFESALEPVLSSREIARTYSVSTVTALKAMNILREKGILNYCHGKRASLSGAEPENKGVNKFYEWLKKEIGLGNIVKGTILEKIEFYAHQHSINRAVVCEALKMLFNEDVIYKKGRHWICGSRNEGIRQYPHTDFIKQKGKVLIITEYVGAWRFYIDSPHFGKMTKGFLGELHSSNIKWELAQLQTTEPETQIFVSAEEAILSKIQETGSSYLGAIIYGHSKEFHKWKDLINNMLRFKQKLIYYFCDVVEFDKTYSFPKHPNLFYSFHNEVRSCELALLHLQAAGHCNAYYLQTLKDETQWQNIRMQMLIRVSKSLKKPFNIFPLPVYNTLEMESWVLNNSFLDFFRNNVNISSEGGAEVAERRTITKSFMQEQFGFLATWIEKGERTAIIVPNDDYAAILWVASSILDNNKPSCIDIISFDNSLQNAHFSFNTLDIGLSQLGYRLAHLLIGDLPVYVEKDNFIYSNPFVCIRS